MRYLIVLAPLALLAACGGDKAASNNVAGNAAGSANATAPAAAPSVTMAPAAPATSNSSSVPAAGTADRRASLMGECTEHMTSLVPPGRATEICDCAVDRVLANNEGEEAATLACSAQLNIPVTRSKS